MRVRTAREPDGILVEIAWVELKLVQHTAGYQEDLAAFGMPRVVVAFETVRSNLNSVAKGRPRSLLRCDRQRSNPTWHGY